MQPLKPGMYLTKEGLQIKIVSCKAVGGEWRLLGALNTMANVWKMGKWTIAGRSITFGDLGNISSVMPVPPKAPEFI